MTHSVLGGCNPRVKRVAYPTLIRPIILCDTRQTAAGAAAAAATDHTPVEMQQQQLYAIHATLSLALCQVDPSTSTHTPSLTLAFPPLKRASCEAPAAASRLQALHSPAADGESHFNADKLNNHQCNDNYGY